MKFYLFSSLIPSFTPISECLVNRYEKTRRYKNYAPLLILYAPRLDAPEIYFKIVNRRYIDLRINLFRPCETVAVFARTLIER